MLKPGVARRASLLYGIAGAFGLYGGGSNGASLVFPLADAPQERGRDPFRPPRGAAEAPRPSGLAGVAILEATVRGIVRVPGDREGRAGGLGLAILEGPDEGFVAGPGDRLFDGVVGRVGDDGVVFWLDGDPDRPVYRALGEAMAAAPEERR